MKGDRRTRVVLGALVAALCGLGIFLLGYWMLDTGPTAEPSKQPIAEIFMRLDVTQSQSDAVRAALADDPAVQSFRFVSHEEAYEDFKSFNRDNPALVKSVRPEDLPTSYRVVTKNSHDSLAIKRAYGRMSGVDSVVTSSRVLGNALEAVSSGP